MQELKDFLIDFLIILSAATPKQIKTMKKNYMKPAMSVVELKNKCQILAGSNDDYVQGNALRGGGSDEKYYEDAGDIR